VGSAAVHSESSAGRNANIFIQDSILKAEKFGIVQKTSGSTSQINTIEVNRTSFSVVGEPFYNYAIQLPPDNTVIMKKGAGGTPDTEIPVNGFDSFPMGLGSLDSNGASTLLVGATRDALAATQESGDYVGTFTVRVVYP
jgi:hypothetical protein